jgi:hypothetical protein
MSHALFMRVVYCKSVVVLSLSASTLWPRKIGQDKYLKVWWHDATLFVYFLYFTIYIHSFNHLHTIHLSVAIRRGLSPYIFAKSVISRRFLLISVKVYEFLYLLSAVCFSVRGFLSAVVVFCWLSGVGCKVLTVYCLSIVYCLLPVYRLLLLAPGCWMSSVSC